MVGPVLMRLTSDYAEALNYFNLQIQYFEIVSNFGRMADGYYLSGQASYRSGNLKIPKIIILKQLLII